MEPRGIFAGVLGMLGVLYRLAEQDQISYLAAGKLIVWGETW